jgi:hypothetical protein
MNPTTSAIKREEVGNNLKTDLQRFEHHYTSMRRAVDSVSSRDHLNDQDSNYLRAQQPFLTQYETLLNRCRGLKASYFQGNIPPDQEQRIVDEFYNTLRPLIECSQKHGELTQEYESSISARIATIMGPAFPQLIQSAFLDNAKRESRELFQRCSFPGCASPTTQKTKRCNGCQLTWYCSVEHQRAHWSRHKLVCVQKEAPSQAPSASSSSAPAATHRCAYPACASTTTQKTKRCGACKNVWYCSEAHQRADWAEH